MLSRLAPLTLIRPGKMERKTEKPEVTWLSSDSAFRFFRS
jgi:hypothetical protein